MHQLFHDDPRDGRDIVSPADPPVCRTFLIHENGRRYSINVAVMVPRRRFHGFACDRNRAEIVAHARSHAVRSSIRLLLLLLLLLLPSSSEEKNFRWYQMRPVRSKFNVVCEGLPSVGDGSSAFSRSIAKLSKLSNRPQRMHNAKVTNEERMRRQERERERERKRGGETIERQHEPRYEYRCKFLERIIFHVRVVTS